jgi:hypothetical protein
MHSIFPIKLEGAPDQAAPMAPPARLERRAFLKSGVVLTGLLAIGSPLALLAPSRAWALELVALTQAQADSIMLLAKTLYPHRNLPDAVYALVLKDIDTKAHDPATAQLIAHGVASLDTAAGGAWHGSKGVGDAARTRIVVAMQTEPFVQMVRAQCITSLYDNEMAYAHFGYQGEAYSKGGYLFRGFNDLSWLPNPPPAASPALGA